MNELFPITWIEHTQWDKKYPEEYLPLQGIVSLCLKGYECSISTKFNVTWGLFSVESTYVDYVRDSTYKRYLFVMED